MANKSVSVSLRADVAQFQSAMKAAATATKQVEGAAKGAGKATQSAGADAAGGAQKITTAATTAATATTRLGTSSQDAATKTQQIGKGASTAASGATALGSAAGAAATGTSRLGAAGEAVGAGLGRAREAVSGAASQVASSIPSFEQLAETARNNDEAWSTASTALMGVGAAALAGVGMAVKTYADYDKAMSSVRAATHASESDMQALGDAAIKAGADTAYSAEEAARGIEELAKAGVSTADILGGGLDGALSLAAAGGLEVGDAAEIAASALTQFKLEGSDVGHVADLLAAGAGKAQGSVHDLGAALNQSGLVAAQTGLSIEETTGGLAAFASAGLTGSDAGTSFKTMLQRLTPQSKEAAELMDELGISAYDSQGQFIGLSEYAGQLQGALSGMSDEQRNAAMQTLFGADAVRAASVLYEQGAAGVEQWEAAVNDAGYAAETAALMQDNLAGDLEKLGGAIETAFLKAGSGGNDALRSLVQTAESVVDAIGRIPGPVLTTVTAIAGLGGAAALVVGSGMKLVTMAADTRDAFSTLGVSLKDSEGNLTRTGRALDTAGRAAARAATAFVALQAAGAIDNVFDKSQALNIEEVTNALTDSGTSLEALDQKFANLDFVNGKNRWSVGGTVSDINSLGDAVARVADRGGFEAVQEGLIGLTGQETAVQKLAGSIGEVDTALAGMFEAGDMAGATDMFAQIAKDAEASGASIQDVADQFPELKGAVLDYATSLDVTLSEQETLDAMMGNLPPKLVDAAGGAEQAAAGLEGLAGASEDTAASLEEVVDSLSALGLLTVDSRSAIAEYEEAVAALGETAAAGGVALNQLGTDFDLTTESGRAASEAMGEVASGGWDAAEGIVAMGGGAADAQASLQGTYDTLVSSAQQMGLSAESAETLARDLMGIPDNVSVETWMDETAATMAQQTKESVDGIPEGKSVDISVDDQGSAAAVQAAVAGIQGTDVKAYVSDQGTVQLTQSQINGILGKTTKVTVTDQGTVYQTQGKIDGVTDGDALITVDDNGTIVNIQSNINGVQDGAASVAVNQSGEGTTSIQQAINSIRGKTVQIAISAVGGGAAAAAVAAAASGKARGGRAPHIPGVPAAATGMRLPTSGPGTSIVDGFLGIASDGMPRVRVDAGEWIINHRSSDAYSQVLGMINRDDPRVRHLKTGAMESLPGYATGRDPNAGATSALGVRPAVAASSAVQGVSAAEISKAAAALVRAAGDMAKRLREAAVAASSMVKSFKGAAGTVRGAANTAAKAMAGVSGSRLSTSSGRSSKPVPRAKAKARVKAKAKSKARTKPRSRGKGKAPNTVIDGTARANRAFKEIKAMRARDRKDGRVRPATDPIFDRPWKSVARSLSRQAEMQYGGKATHLIFEDGSGQIKLSNGVKLELNKWKARRVKKFRYNLGLAKGGRLPATGLGTDQIVGVSSLTGLPTAMVDDREWVINRRMSDRYDGLLGAINRDDPRVRHLAGYATGGRAESTPSPVSAHMTAQRAAGPQVDTAAIGAAVAGAMAGWQPVVTLGGREFVGAMRQAERRLRI